MYGLFELDPSGTVLYAKTQFGMSSADEKKKFVGLNFFDEFAPFIKVEEFQRRFRCFAKGSDAAEKFSFVCEFDEQPLEIKVLLTQISEREFDVCSKLIIVDIRKA